MKRIILSLCMFFILFVGNANPVYIPEVFIKSFSFDNNQHWELSLIKAIKVDSMRISTSSSVSFYLPPFSRIDDIISITSDSLESNLAINVEGDSLTITSFYQGWNDNLDSITEVVVFGNYPSAYLPAPINGHSIIRVLESVFESNYYCICDSLGNIGSRMHGKIYDYDNNILTSGSINLSPYPTYVPCADEGYFTEGIDISADGSYSAGLYSRRYDFSSINICKKLNSWGCDYYVPSGSLRIDPINISLVPGASVEMDIHLLDKFASVDYIENTPVELIKVYPNPLTDRTLKYEIVVPVRSANCVVKLLNAKGQYICSYKLSENKGVLTLPDNVDDGLYVLQLWMNQKAYSSSEILVAAQ